MMGREVISIKLRFIEYVLHIKYIGYKQERGTFSSSGNSQSGGEMDEHINCNYGSIILW